MIATWYGIAGFMLIVYVVLDGRNFGAGMLHWLVAKTPRRTPAGHRRDRSALVLARSVAGRFRRHLARGIPQASGIRLCRVLPRALSHLVVFDFARHLAGSRRPHQRSHVAGVLGFRLRVRQYASGHPLRRGGGQSGPGCSARLPTARSRWPFSPISRHAAMWACSTGTRYRLRSSPLSSLAAHGATYLTLKTEGPVHDRSARYARVLWAAAAPLLLVISVESAVVRPDLLGHAIHNPFWWLGLLLVCAAAIALVSGLATRREMRAFIGSNLLLAGLLATGAAAIFPVVLHSTLAPKTHSPLTTSPPVPIRWRTPRSGGRSVSRWRPRISFSSRDDTPAKSASHETTRASTKRVHQQDQTTSEELTMDTRFCDHGRRPANHHRGRGLRRSRRGPRPA